MKAGLLKAVLPLLLTGCVDWAGARLEYCRAHPQAGCEGFEPDAGDEADSGLPGQVTFTVLTGDAGATGRIEWLDGGVACDEASSPCTLTSEAGTQVVVRGQAGRWSVLSGLAGCEGADPFGRCTVTASADASVAATFERPNLVFVTSSRYPVGGFALPDAGTSSGDATVAADAVCTAVAQGAGLPGTWVAFLGQRTPASNPLDGPRLGNARGWIRLDGKPVFDVLSRSGEFAAPLYVPRLDEFGNPLAAGERIATGLNPMAQAMGVSDCQNYTNSTQGSVYLQVGDPHLGGSHWLSDSQLPCGDGFHLACFENDRHVPVQVDQSQPARLAFVTSRRFVPDGGLAAADALCALEASTRHGRDGGGFDAFLFAQDGTPAWERLGRTPVPWARPDGVVVVPSPLAYLDAPATSGPLEPLSNGTETFFVGNGSSTCQGWTSNTITNEVIYGGRAWVTGVDWDLLPPAQARCVDVDRRLACFER